ncbi:hypothetical protein [Chondromyces crocatus]|uniref:Uncharacterized protein n=1 Tax=Chondromyces crocatus TaxID=52 RepID=A0A0K1EHZ7_CHOCO|nr:hypothetical protein [Chondromyces crocatus]AKT40307.1 uncharacterized protein CMC5_044600 [Chondromyces crocatus]
MSKSPLRAPGRTLAVMALTGVGVTAALSGCSSAGPHAGAPSSKYAAAEVAAPVTPSSPEEALNELDRAEWQLAQIIGGNADRAFATPPGAGAAPAEAPALPTPQQAPAPPPKTTGESREDRPEPLSERRADERHEANACTSACHALASMSRAANNLCGLAGEVDGRCLGARTRVKNATDRVQSQCPACSL